MYVGSKVAWVCEISCFFSFPPQKLQIIRFKITEISLSNSLKSENSLYIYTKLAVLPSRKISRFSL
jgi:hypothetical protein